MLVPYIPYGDTNYYSTIGYLFGASGAVNGLAKVQTENGEEVKQFVALLTKQDEIREARAIFAITDKLSWACEPVWSQPGDWDHTEQQIGNYYCILAAETPGTYYITVPEYGDEQYPITEKAIKRGIKMTLEVPSAGIYMFPTPYEFTGEENVIGEREYSEGHMETVLLGIAGYAAQYKQVSVEIAGYTDEGIYVKRIPMSQRPRTQAAQDIQIYGRAPEGATEIHFSAYTGSVDRASLEASLIVSTKAIQADRLFWSKVENTTDWEKVGDYCGVVWCEAPPGGTFLANATVSVVCLSGDTLITTADGGSKRLDELSEGERVMGRDGEPTEIVKLERGNYSPRHSLYRFDDGTVIDETHEHRFYNVERDALTKLKDWELGEHARKQDGSAPALVSKEEISEIVEMFGLWTESGCYYANGLLSGDISAAFAEPIEGGKLEDIITSIPQDKIQNILGEQGWFE